MWEFLLRCFFIIYIQNQDFSTGSCLILIGVYTVCVSPLAYVYILKTMAPLAYVYILCVCHLMNMMNNFLDLDHLISGPVLAKGNKCNVVCDFHVFYIDS